MNICEPAIRRPVGTTLLAIGLLLVGIVAYRFLPVASMPTVDQAAGRQLMLDHRAGLELLRLSLREIGSPWASLIDAVTATLPPLRGDERDAVRRLAAEGPPEEEVGLAPFAAPSFSPGAPADPDLTLLPMPSFPGARR